MLWLLELFDFTLSCLSMYTSFMVYLSYILPLLTIYYWFSPTCYSHIIQRMCFFYFFKLLVQLLFWFSSNISVRLSSSALMKPPFSYTHFSFPSLTLLSLSPFLHPSFPYLTSLFWLSITKSKTFALLSSSDSSFSSCPSILFSSCFSAFSLPNTFFSF